jgi:copper chaperone CopZ
MRASAANACSNCGKGNRMSTFAKIIVLVIVPVVLAFADAPQVAIVDLRNVQCYACLKTVKRALQNVPGVQDAQMDLETKTATVKFDRTKTNMEASQCWVRSRAQPICHLSPC